MSLGFCRTCIIAQLQILSIRRTRLELFDITSFMRFWPGNLRRRLLLRRPAKFLAETLLDFWRVMAEEPWKGRKTAANDAACDFGNTTWSIASNVSSERAVFEPQPRRPKNKNNKNNKNWPPQSPFVQHIGSVLGGNIFYIGDQAKDTRKTSAFFACESLVDNIKKRGGRGGPVSRLTILLRQIGRRLRAYSFETSEVARLWKSARS